MRRILFFLLFCVTTILVAQTRFRTTVPYHNEAGKLIVSVQVNGHPARFLLDTGAPCCITYSLAQRLGLQAGEALPGQDSNGQSVQAHLVILDSLRLGGLTLQSLQALRWEEGNLTEQMGIDGIIGYNLFDMGIIKFDGKQSLFTFTSHSRDLGIRPECALPLLNNEYVPLIPVHLNAQTVDTVMFDSGASSLYEMSSHRFQLLGKKHPALRHLASARGILSMGAAGLAQQSELHRLCIPQLSIANAHFRQLTTITTDGRDSRLGAALLRYGDVIIDYKRRVFYYQPYEEKSPPNLYHKEWDVVIVVQNNRLTAGIVWDASLPIKSGDRILAINGQRVPEIVDLHQATTQAMFSMPGDRAKITFLHSQTQQEQTIEIKRR